MTAAEMPTFLSSVRVKCSHQEPLGCGTRFWLNQTFNRDDFPSKWFGQSEKEAHTPVSQSTSQGSRELPSKTGPTFQVAFEAEQVSILKVYSPHYTRLWGLYLYVRKEIICREDHRCGRIEIAF